MAVGKKDIPPLDSEDILGHPTLAWNPLELPTFRKGQEVFGQKRRFLAGIGFHGPLPMRFVGPIGGVGKAGDEHAIGTSVHGPSHVVEVQVGQEHVGDVLTCKACRVQASIQGMVAMQVVMAEELLRLFVPNATIHKHEAIADFHQQRTHGPCAQILGIRRIGPRPKLLGHHPKHRPAIQFEIPGVNRVQTHGAKVDMAHAT